MIKEAYVSFEVAKLLKKKGFKQETPTRYAIGNITESWYDEYRERVIYFDWGEGYFLGVEDIKHDIYGETISAPTQQMAMAWLREEKKIFIDIVTYTTSNNIQFRWIGYDNGRLFSQEEDKTIYFNSYEETVEAALKYSLENII